MLGLLMPIKDRLKELRTANDLTQQALATKAGLSVSAVVQIESGKIPDPRISTLRKLARGLGVSLDELAGEEEDDGGSPPPAAEQLKNPRPKKGK
jgi:transcriptional regulator with XRE-family HTH domain